MSNDRGYALVTGASQGIGAAIALELARKGFGVIVTARTEAALLKVRDEAARINGGRGHAIVVDLLADGAVERIVREINEKQLPLTCLVNNAGFAHWGLFSEVEMDVHRT